MAKIVIRTFGPLVPKAALTALPDAAGQVSVDLRADSDEFRPVPADTTPVAASGTTDPLTIHRLSRKADGTFNTDFSTGWIVKPGLMSFAKTQINNDTTERTCATFDDGSQPPRVYTAADLVTGRLLGAPAPTTAPVVTLNTVDEFTVEERDSGITGTLAYIYNEAAAKCSMVWVGAAHPTFSGYADRDSVIGGDPQEAQQVRIFRTGSSGGAFGTAIIDETYTGVPAAAFTWISDPSLGGYWQTQGAGWPAWSTSGRDHFLIPFHAYGMTYTVDLSALGAVLAAMATPGVDGSPILTSDQVTAIEADITAFMAGRTSLAQPSIDALKAKVQEIHTILDYGISATTISNWYASTAIATLRTTAIANAADAIWKAALDAHGHFDYAPPV